MLPTLYMMDAKGKLKQWSVSVNSVEGFYTIAHGLYEGKRQTKTTVCKPKNVGKKNETTAVEQAFKEAESKHAKQKDKGYVESIEEALGNKTLLPQLANDFSKLKKELQFEKETFYTSPKLDGVRCLADFDEKGEVKFTSRGGKEYNVPEHLAKQVQRVLERCTKDMVLDGELYIHGLELQDIVSAVKKPNENTPRIKYCIYDLAGNYGETHTFEERLVELNRLAKSYLRSIEHVPHVKVNSSKEIWEHHDEHVANGFEGVMIRAGGKGSEYKHGYRSRALLKAKVMIDEEFLIIGHTIDKDGCIVFVVKVDDKGAISKVNMKASKQEKLEMAKNGEKYIGKLLKVQYQARTNGNSLQFPVGLQIRENNGDDF